MRPISSVMHANPMMSSSVRLSASRCQTSWLRSWETSLHLPASLSLERYFFPHGVGGRSGNNRCLQLIWNPLTFLDKLMEGERYTHGNRTACAFIALAFVYSTVFSAIFENSIPYDRCPTKGMKDVLANDLSALETTLQH